MEFVKLEFCGRCPLTISWQTGRRLNKAIGSHPIRSPAPALRMEFDRTNRFAPYQSLPCVKGGGTVLAVTEGLCSRYSFYCKANAKSHCGNNPSVKNQKIFDSFLYTREPFRSRLILQKSDLRSKPQVGFICFTNPAERLGFLLTGVVDNGILCLHNCWKPDKRKNLWQGFSTFSTGFSTSINRKTPDKPGVYQGWQGKSSVLLNSCG